MTDRDRLRLAGVHPRLVEAVTAILWQMEAGGHPMFVVEGLRTSERQQELYSHGRTKPHLQIITYKDGVLHKSNHQAYADGYGHAVDCAFQADSPFASAHPWAAYGALARGWGLVWGGDWAQFCDRPHIELPTAPPTNTLGSTPVTV